MFNLLMQNACFYKVFIYEGLESPSWHTLIILLYGETPLILLPLSYCMMASIMLVDSPSVGYRKAWPKVGSLFGKETLFYQNKRFYENLGRDIPDPSEFIKWSYSGGVWFWKMFSDGKRFLIKQHMVLCNYPLQHHRATTLPWGGTGLSL